MPSTSQNEIKIFNRHVRNIRYVYRETKGCFKEIERCQYFSSYFTQEQLHNFGFSTEEETSITELFTNAPSIIVFGQSRYAKSSFVNGLFHQAILPLVDDSDETANESDGYVDGETSWRMVRFKYGRTQTMSIALPDNYELVRPMAAYQRPSSTTIPLEDLEIRNHIAVRKVVCSHQYSASTGEEDNYPIHAAARSISPTLELAEDRPYCFGATETGGCDIPRSEAVSQFENFVSSSPWEVIQFEDIMENYFGTGTAEGTTSRREPFKSNSKSHSRSRSVEEEDDWIIEQPVDEHGSSESAADSTGIDEDYENFDAVLEVCLNNSFLREGARVVVAPCNHKGLSVSHVYRSCVESSMPIAVYVINRETLSEKDVEELAQLRKIAPDLPILFAIVRSGELPESERHDPERRDSERPDPERHDLQLSRHHVARCPDISSAPPPSRRSNAGNASPPRPDNQSDHQSNSYQHSFDASYPGGPMNSTYNALMSVPPSSSFVFLYSQLSSIGYVQPLGCESMQESMTTEGNFEYRAQSQLVEFNFDNLSVNFLVQFIRHSLRAYSVRALGVLCRVHQRSLSALLNTAFDLKRYTVVTPKRIEYTLGREKELFQSLMNIAQEKQEEIRQMVAKEIAALRNNLIDAAGKLLPKNVEIPADGIVRQSSDLQKCTAQIQSFVLNKLNLRIADNLVRSVNVLKENYLGTLKRCLKSLEAFDEENQHTATKALKQILNAAYKVELNANASSSFIWFILEKMKQFMASMPWKTPPTINEEWKRQVAADTLDSLSESKLAKSICAQFKDRLRQSHDAFLLSMRQLEARHTGQLEATLHHQERVRKSYSPRIAKLFLDATSLRDTLVYGVPQMGREIGRGQYGVVYSCDRWANYRNCAVKSVVPPDDKHWRDLALEFYYTRLIPEHERIVSIRGAVIDSNYGGGGGAAAILLIMERMHRDFYTAIKQGLNFISRLVVAADVVEGLRYLHSQGLAHRDIKLKNVLLDRNNRGKITDLGFCKSEAMISGSVVGTPIHMAPELFSGQYDGSVDVYAFGILFWYVCAGHVRLPFNFDKCASKDHLWNAVKKGWRPERLLQFSDDCWKLMSDCWSGTQAERPLLGEVQERLKLITENAVKTNHR